MNSIMQYGQSNYKVFGFTSSLTSANIHWSTGFANC